MKNKSVQADILTLTRRGNELADIRDRVARSTYPEYHGMRGCPYTQVGVAKHKELLALDESLRLIESQKREIYQANPWLIRKSED